MTDQTAAPTMDRPIHPKLPLLLAFAVGAMLGSRCTGAVGYSIQRDISQTFNKEVRALKEIIADQKSKRQTVDQDTR